jgi:hypothetical protein
VLIQFDAEAATASRFGLPEEHCHRELGPVALCTRMRVGAARITQSGDVVCSTGETGGGPVTGNSGRCS